MAVRERLYCLADVFESLRLWKVGTVLFLVTVAVRAALFVAMDRWKVISRSEVEQVTISLLNTGSFANPYSIPTGPTAHVAPVYPALLQLVYRAFGTGLGGEWAEQLFAVLMVATVFGLLPLLSLKLLGEKTPGIIAGGIAAVSPGAFHVETQGKDAPLASLLFLVCVFATVWLIRRRAFAPRHAVLYGLCWALMLLTHPGFLLVLLALLATGCAIVRQHVQRHWWRFPVLTLAVCAAALSPWIIRNFGVFGHVFFLRDNYGLELALSNHDSAKVIMTENAEAGSFKRHPWISKDEAYSVKALGEFQYHQARQREALDWIRSHPMAFGKLTAERAVHFWLPYRFKWHQAPALIVTSSLALVGVALLYRLNHVKALACGLVWASYSLPYIFVQGCDRYLYPIQWTLYLMAGIAVAAIAKRAKAYSAAGARTPTSSTSASRSVGS